MPRVAFTPNLQRHLACPPRQVSGNTVRAVLDQVFLENPALRGYILDDQGHLRQHVNIFINDRMISHRKTLTDKVDSDSEVFVMQALSGG